MFAGHNLTSRQGCGHTRLYRPCSLQPSGCECHCGFTRARRKGAWLVTCMPSCHQLCCALADTLLWLVFFVFMVKLDPKRSGWRTLGPLCDWQTLALPVVWFGTSMIMTLVALLLPPTCPATHPCRTLCSCCETAAAHHPLRGTRGLGAEATDSCVPLTSHSLARPGFAQAAPVEFC